MKKFFLLTIFLLLTLNTTLLAFETDLYKVNDNGWKHKEDSGLLIFTQENSKEFIDPETKQKADSDIYIILRTLDFNELTPDDYNPNNVEEFKKKFQDYYTRSIKNQKNQILKNIEKEFPWLGKEYLEKKVNKRFERCIINSCSVKTIGNFKSYFIDFYNENFNVKYYSLHTMNHRYQIQLYYHKDVAEDDLKPAMKFINSFEPKDIAPTKLNEFLYGNGLKFTLAILLLLAFLIFRFFNSKRT
jgi:hypothetical protein